MKREWRQIVMPDGSVRRVQVQVCPPGAAEGAERFMPRRKASKRGRGHLRKWSKVRS